MIYVCFGTQAELIKLAPVLRELAARGVAHRIIDSGQQPLQTQLLQPVFGLRPPDVRLHVGKGVFTGPKALVWGGRIVSSCALRRRRFRTMFGPSGVRRDGPDKGVCVVHGDTLSTLLFAMISRMMGLKLAHVESGLRSFRWFNPFPEEIVRVIANRRADVLFAPGQWACDNLRRMKVKGRVVPLPCNTGKEALEYVLAQPGERPAAAEPYALASIHRYETVSSRRYFRMAVQAVLRASKVARVIWPLHTVTRNAMSQDLLAQLQQANVQLCDTLPYVQFAHLLAGAQFVLADGGSIQEESFFLGKPCLLLRHATERQEGLGQNVLLSQWRPELIEQFLADTSQYARPCEMTGRPSTIIVDELVRMDL